MLLLAGIVACNEDSNDDNNNVPDASTPKTDSGAPVVACDLTNGSISLPNGFCATVFADGLERPRQMTVNPAGDVFVAIKNSPEGDLGGIAALRDADGDGIAEQIERFGDNGGNGIAWHDRKLYFAQDAQILQYTIPDGQLVPTAAPVIAVGGLPAAPDHAAKTIVFGGDDMFVNIGSASNSCQVANRELESRGMDPCPELSERAGIWRFDAGMTGLTQADGERYATGVRNGNALAIHPDTGALVALQNGRDQLFENWPMLYTAADDQRLPAEELFVISEGGKDYGWPYCYYDAELGQMVLAPEYGGDGLMVGRCDAVEPPDAVYPAHWAPLSVQFYTGDQFPEAYRDGAFIAFHGSRFDPQAPGGIPGYNVVFQPFENGAPSGAYLDFALDFAGAGRPLPTEAEHRPIGLAQGPDGSLYISDDQGGRIWRVFYMPAGQP